MLLDVAYLGFYGFRCFNTELTTKFKAIFRICCARNIAEKAVIFSSGNVSTYAFFRLAIFRIGIYFLFVHFSSYPFRRFPVTARPLRQLRHCLTRNKGDDKLH